MSSYDEVKTEKREELFFPEYLIDKQSVLNGTAFCNNQQYVQLKVNNDNKKRSLSASVSVFCNSTPNDKQNGILDYDGYNTQHTESTEGKESKSMRSSAALNGTFYLNSVHQIKVRLNGSYTKKQLQEDLH